MECSKLYDDTYQFDEGGVRFFLLIGSEKSLLIDSGMKTKNALDLVREYTSNEIMLVNTHTDMDHIGSNAQFEFAYMHPSECVNYSGKSKPVWDCQIIDLGNRKVQVIHIPGHTPGSIALLDMDNRTLFSGDSIQKDGKIFMFGPMRNLQANVQSLERLESMSSFGTLYPSHGTTPLTRESISMVKKGCMDILLGDIAYTEASFFNNFIKVYDIGSTIILCD